MCVCVCVVCVYRGARVRARFTGLQKTRLQGLLVGAEIGYQMEKCECGFVFTCGFL